MRAFAVDDTSRILFHELPGEGPPLLFVHGLGCASSSDYPTAAADPALGGRRRLLVDLLGFGFSDRPEAFGYRVEDHAHVLSQLLDGLRLESVDLFGHSMGGAVAIALAARAPARVARLVVSEPNLEPGGGFFSRAIAAYREAAYVDKGHRQTVASARREGHLAWAASLAVASPLAVHRGAVSLVKGSSPSWLAQLERLPMPRVALFGSRSLPDADAVKLERSGVPVRVVPDAGHSMATDNPAGFARALAEALPPREGEGREAPGYQLGPTPAGGLAR